MSASNVSFVEKDSSAGIKSCFRYAVKCMIYHCHISLETCKHSSVFPSALMLDKKPFISFVSDKLIASWEDAISSTQHQLLETLLVDIMEKLMNFETELWLEVVEIVNAVNHEDLERWLFVHIEKEENILKRKRIKIRKPIINENYQKAALDRMEEHKNCFTFKNDLLSYCTTIFKNFENFLAKMKFEHPK